MAVLPIVEFPDPLLRRRAKPVRGIDRRTRRLIDDMVDTVRAACGVGLAANQVGVLRRVIVIQMPEETGPRAYVNPRIVYRHGYRDIVEGCLSVPGYSAVITRSIWIRAAGLDGELRVVRLHADGLLAQALEHEIDHLNGIMYMDHLKSHQELVEDRQEVERLPVEAAVA